MAQLVKFYTRPQKYYLRRHEQSWPINHVICRQTYEFKNDFPSRFSAFETQVAEILSDYLATWEKEIARAGDRGSVHRRQRILADIITLAALWQRNIAVEVQAMLALSTKIAETILNAPLNPLVTKKSKKSLTNKLKDFFYINIILPESDLNTPTPVPSQSLKYFAEALFLTIDKHDKDALIKICLHGDVQSVELTGIDVRRMISMVLKKFKNRTIP